MIERRVGGRAALENGRASAMAFVCHGGELFSVRAPGAVSRLGVVGNCLFD